MKKRTLFIAMALAIALCTSGLVANARSEANNSFKAAMATTAATTAATSFTEAQMINTAKTGVQEVRAVARAGDNSSMTINTTTSQTAQNTATMIGGTNEVPEAGITNPASSVRFNNTDNSTRVMQVTGVNARARSAPTATTNFSNPRSYAYMITVTTGRDPAADANTSFV